MIIVSDILVVDDLIGEFADEEAQEEEGEEGVLGLAFVAELVYGGEEVLAFHD